MKERMGPRFAFVLAVKHNLSLLICSANKTTLTFYQKMLKSLFKRRNEIILCVVFLKAAAFRCWEKCQVQII